MSDAICERSDLPVSMCSHCRGHDVAEVLDRPIALGLPIEAEFGGRCEACERGIPVGGEIVRTADYGWVHLDCAQVA